jgi:hypothetical protein
LQFQRELSIVATRIGELIMKRGLFTAFSLLALSLLASPAWANIGRVKSASGGTVIERAGKRLAVAPGFVVLVGDIISTPARGRVGITFVDNCRLSAGPGSRVTLSQFEFDDTTQSGQFRADIRKGSVAIIGGSIARSGKKAMLVRTPTSLFAVRGARIVVTVR